MTFRLTRKQGFTLIELLVVIAIIAVLAAILFPVYSKAREKGRQTVCASNLRQIGMATRAYADDHDSFLPLANSQPSLDGPPCITDVLLSYTKSRQIFHCPSDKSDKFKTEGTSYDWGFGALSPGIKPQRIDRPGGISPVRFPLTGDFEKGWHISGINVLYGDGHVKLVTR